MSEAREGNLAQRSLSRVLRAAQDEQERIITKKLYLTLSNNLTNIKVMEFVEDSYLYINDYTRPIEWRIGELVNLEGRLSTIAEARTDQWIQSYRSNFHKMAHRYWYAGALDYLRKRRQRGRTWDPLQLPLYEVEDMVTRFGERWVIPWGKDVVDVTFGPDFHSPQFVAALHNPPQLLPGGGEQIDPELKNLLQKNAG
ncbi:MAG TPA: hypothetical protein VGS11_10755 [Candidatus Bathyarchaeia archaeon]|nr:hypothetical protein [Candidatus Bathyarchaeia archaeon]